jgi:hypothetical protein
VLVTGDRVQPSDDVIASVRERTTADQQAAAARARLAHARRQRQLHARHLRRDRARRARPRHDRGAGDGRDAHRARRVERAPLGSASVMVAGSLDAPPSDVVGEVALVQLANGRVSSYGYREPQGHARGEHRRRRDHRGAAPAPPPTR